MADLISRAAAIETCKSIVPNTNPDFYNLRSKAGYGSWMHSNGEVCAITNIETKIEALPAVDAIPVEWMRGYTAVGVAPTGDRLTEGKERLIVHRILNEWQKEQEAR